MNTRTTYRTLPVYYYREGYDLDGVELHGLLDTRVAA